ncbi:MAG: GNAT family N-acetyltransferase [Gammaproteobacteria bacterium]|nr:GNAT family N-acetyltransferase [Gammaproteobacteria bacterium]
MHDLTATRTFRFEKMADLHARDASQARMTSQEFGLFSKMDVSFWELFFKTITLCPAVIAWVAVDKTNDRLAGYIIGTADSSATTRFLVKEHPLALMWYGLKMLVLHPRQLKLVFKNIFADKHQIAIPRQRWITWVVAPEYRKHGLGMELYGRLCAEMQTRGIREFYGPVDCENAASNAAHKKINAQIVGTIIVDGRAHYLWKHDSAYSNPH